VELNGLLLYLAWFGTLFVPPVLAGAFWRAAHRRRKPWLVHLLFVLTTVGATLALAQIMFSAGGEGLGMGLLLIPSLAVLLLTVTAYLLRLSFNALRARMVRTNGS
jgi:peptidoglycan/LPS O-acetylase OafA/YrhL